MYSLVIAYILWLLGGFGTLGLHRFYLRKVPTGLLWLVTGGAFMIGSIYDLVTLPKQVQKANGLSPLQGYTPLGVKPPAAPPPPRESLEKLILRTARQNGGTVTPAEAALEGDFNVEETRRELDRLAKQGFCELRVSSQGWIFYYFFDLDRHNPRDKAL